jgi:hypothetical protein
MVSARSQGESRCRVGLEDDALTILCRLWERVRSSAGEMVVNLKEGE